MSRAGLRLSVTLLSILPEGIVRAARPAEPRTAPDQADPARAGRAGRAGWATVPPMAGGLDDFTGPPWPDAEPPALDPAGRGSAPGAGPSRPTAAEAMLWAPVVGLALGVIAAAVLYVAGQLLHTGSLVAAVLAVGTLAVLSRGLHLDGLADLADGLGSRRPPTEALEIMRRSDIGPFGVVTLVFTLLIQVAGLTQADADGRGVPAVIVAAVTGRLAITWACRRGVPPARRDGLGALVADSVAPATAAVVTLAVLAVTVGGIFLAAAVADVPVEWILPVAVGAGLVAGVALGERGARRLGGVTGDVLGAVSEAATAACLLVTAIS
ncbi:MAG TPA: adenosylcobinamide-GDP ribazoletransferase [Streptosporangiaceae bacterium]|jgi:adenosylcobinamide-GDP ribazoletransferase|nr:adenosylcobinamide-GDP ribazoletransferase [Streptosporangiaceae bacterium]